MRVLKQIFNFYINSSIHVALAVYALSWITLKQFAIEYDENVLYFIFYASIIGYNFVKYFGLAKMHHRSLANWFKVIPLFTFICFVLMVLYACKLKIEVLFLAFGFGMITFFYAIPFLPKKMFIDDRQNLRNIAGLKVYVIAFVWAGVTVVIPLINNDFAINFDAIITVIQRFLFVVVLILPFDIRDLQFDKLRLSTIPQKIGVKNTKFIGVLLLLVFFFLEFLKDDFDSKQLIGLLILIFVTTLFVLFSSKERSKYYSAFWVEGLPVFWLGFMMMFS